MATLRSLQGKAVHALNVNLMLWVWAKLTDVGAHAGSGVNSDDDSMLEDES